jgi:hypothetical protein
MARLEAACFSWRRLEKTDDREAGGTLDAID